MTPDRRRHAPVAISALGGATAGLSMPPIGWWWLAPLGVAAVVVAVRGASLRSRLARGAAAGVAFHAVAFAGLVPLRSPGLVLAAEVAAAVVLSGWWAAAAALARRWPALTFPAALVVVAWLQGRWPFGGWPGLTVATGQAGSPLGDVAPYAGELGVLAATAGVGGALAAIGWSSDRRRPLALGAGLVVVIAVAAVVSPLSVDPTGGTPITVAAVQGGGTRGVGAIPPDEAFDRQVAATAALPDGVDLVLLPEGTLHAHAPARASDGAERLGRLARRLDATLVAGVTEWLDGARFSNQAVAWDPTGGIAGSYAKRHGVPFAEYVPGRHLLDAVIDLSLVPRDMVPGRDAEPVVTPAGRVGVLVSFEVFFGRLARESVRAGAELLVVPTNAASFAGDGVPALEVAVARMRARETGRWVVQAAPTGASAVIAPDGRVVAYAAPSSEAATVTATAYLRDGVTPWTVTGDLPVLLAALVALGAQAAVRRRRPAHQTATGGAAEERIPVGVP